MPCKATVLTCQRLGTSLSHGREEVVDPHYSMVWSDLRVLTMFPGSLRPPAQLLAARLALDSNTLAASREQQTYYEELVVVWGGLGCLRCNYHLPEDRWKPPAGADRNSASSGAERNWWYCDHCFTERPRTGYTESGSQPRLLPILAVTLVALGGVVRAASGPPLVYLSLGGIAIVLFIGAAYQERRRH